VPVYLSLIEKETTMGLANTNSLNSNLLTRFGPDEFRSFSASSISVICKSGYVINGNKKRLNEITILVTPCV